MGDVGGSNYTAEIEHWRPQREVELRAPDGWLALAGLFVLADGRYLISSAAENEIRLPASAAPHVGEIVFQGCKAVLAVADGASVLVDGVPARTASLIDNGHQRQPTLVTTGSVTFFIHKLADFAPILLTVRLTKRQSSL